MRTPSASVAIGTRLGELTLLAHLPPPKFGKPVAVSLWRCACGREKTFRTSAVVCGYSRSCGCAGQRAMRGNMRVMRAEAEARKAATGR